MIDPHNLEPELERYRARKKARPMRGPNCPAEDKIIELAAGVLPESESEALMDHVAECAHCVQLLETFVEVCDTPVTDEEEELAASIRPPERRPVTARPAAAPRRWALAVAASLVVLAAPAWLVYQRWAPEPEKLLARAYMANRPSEVRIPEAAQPAPIQSRTRSSRSVFDRPAAWLEVMKEIGEQVDRHPQDPRWIRVKALALLFDLRLDPAEEELKNAQKLDPTRHFDMEFGLLAYERQQYPEAAQRFAKVLALQPGNQAARFNHALSLKNLGDRAGARRELEALLSASPDIAWAEEARQQLRAMDKDASAVPESRPR